MGKTIKGKDAAKAKKAALKTRLKKLKGKEAYASVCVVVAALLAVVGCSTATPASRYTAATYGDINIYGQGNRVTIGDGAFAQADSSGSTETQSATPTNTTDVKPDVSVSP